MKKSIRLNVAKAIGLLGLVLISFASVAQGNYDDYNEIDLGEYYERFRPDYYEYYYQSQKEESRYQESYKEEDLYNGGYKRKKASSQSRRLPTSNGLIGDLSSEERGDEGVIPETIEAKPNSSYDTQADSIAEFEPDDQETPPPPTEPGVPVDTAIPLLLVMGVFVAVKGILFKR
jgi:hypothetical protein